MGFIRLGNKIFNAGEIAAITPNYGEGKNRADVVLRNGKTFVVQVSVDDAFELMRKAAFAV